MGIEPIYFNQLSQITSSNFDISSHRPTKDLSKGYFILEIIDSLLPAPFMGFMGAIDLQNAMQLRPHEATISHRVDQKRLYFINKQRIKKPIFVLYDTNEDIHQRLTLGRKPSNLIAQSKTKQTLHRLYLVRDLTWQDHFRQQLFQISSGIIADGHHRLQGFLETSPQRKEASWSLPSVWADFSQVKILSFYLEIVMPVALLDTFEHQLYRWGTERKNDLPLKEYQWYYWKKGKQRKFEWILSLHKPSIAGIDLFHEFIISRLSNQISIKYHESLPQDSRISNSVFLYFHPVSSALLRSRTEKGGVFPPKSTRILPRISNQLFTYHCNPR